MRIASSSRRSLETGERRRVDCRLSRGVSPLSSQLEATLSTQETTSLFERDERRFIKATLLETGERRRRVVLCLAGEGDVSNLKAETT